MIKYYIALVWTKIPFERSNRAETPFLPGFDLENEDLRAKIYLKFYIGFRAFV